MKLRGRHWVVVWLVGFLVMGAVVVWRQTAALATARQLKALQTTRQALEVTRAAAAAEVRRASSRGVLQPLVQSRLHMRLPSDTEIVILQDPRAR